MLKVAEELTVRLLTVALAEANEAKLAAPEKIDILLFLVFYWTRFLFFRETKRKNLTFILIILFYKKTKINMFTESFAKRESDILIK